MSRIRKILELIVLGGCAFILTKALLSMVLGPGETPTDGNPVWKLILALSYLSVAGILVAHHREAFFAVRRNWFLVALVLVALVSCLWAEMPTLVLRRGIAVFGTTLFGVALAVRLSLEEQLRLMSWVFRIIAVLSLACIVLAPSYGISDWVEHQGEWRGIFDHKNGLGSVMALSILVEWHLPTQTRFSVALNRLALVLSAVLLIFSSSMTPMIALAASLLFLQIYKFAMQRLRIPVYAIVLATLLMIASGATMLFIDSERVTSALGRTSDLTGRTEIWGRVMSYIPERPVLGYGYSGFWYGASSKSLTVDQVMGTRIMYSHNGYLEILLTLGAVGLLLALGFLATGIKRAFDLSERHQSSVYLWPLAFLFFLTVHNIGECTILLQDLEWALCVGTIVSADATLFATEVEQEEEFLLLPSEEFT